MKPTNKPLVYTKAIIYCRVSSTRQKVEGQGLESQEHRCRQYAELHGYEVVTVFQDDFTGAGDFMARPGMRKLIEYLDNNRHTNYVVIFDDLKRLSRDTIAFLKVRQALRARFADAQCPNFKFEETPEGLFIETILAAQGQLEKDQNGRQVRQKQQARLEKHCWSFHRPPGLKFIKHPQYGNILAPDEPVATIFKNAIEKYSNFELVTHEHVRQYILDQYQSQGLKIKLSLNGVKKILTNVLYAGWIEYKPWGIELAEGVHEGFITWDTFRKVQDRIKLVAKPRMRKDYSEDFPLRNFVLCPECRKRCTAGWFPGKSGERFPYYLCKQASCSHPQKMIQRLQLNKDFTDLVKDLKPKPKVAEAVQQFLVDVWSNRKQIETDDKVCIVNNIGGVEKKIADFMERIDGTKSIMLAKHYETEVEKFLLEKEDLEQQMLKQTYSESNFAHIQDVVVKHLENPIDMWETKHLARKRLLLNMYFNRGVAYNKKTGFQTPDLPLIVKVLTSKNTSKNSLVEMMGVKPMSKTGSPSDCSQD